MHRAALMLKESKDIITCIDGAVGYDNPSKFAAAFRSIMKKSPKEYRDSIIETEEI
ncbi:helix-turn-helix domain-containing protein [endosymbiont 'TC1' of Trimyema compressum]|uniref:helix-turn-helix domain-containing protein n=1 Tax=endosymbiont 'TC1' of Trimyema compressum TaxID=243899 RepID=UPI001FDFEA12|nr:AraC family transcriptional regulator [endosymbiont 'TC1' of Trimyema compressum]